MFLFGKKQSKTELKAFSFTLAKGFRGFKRFPITIYGNKESEKNNELLKAADLRGHILTFMPGSSSTYKEPFYQIFADNLQIGSIFDADQINSINSGKIEEVFARSEPESTMINNKVVERPYMRLFVKYKED